MRYFRVELMVNDKPQGSYMVPADKPLELDSCDGDDHFQITLVKMTKKKYNKLLEFTGF